MSGASGAPRTVRATPIKDGPLLVRGADRVVDADGQEHDVRRPVVALCTCTRSQRLPWCDATHKWATLADPREGTPRQ